MAATMRESGPLPCIKCSFCGTNVEISLMGDHVCATSQIWPSVRSLGKIMGRKPAPTSAPPKPFTLPQIDSYIANKPFIDVDSLMASCSASGSEASPATPQDGQPFQQHPNEYNHNSSYNADRTLPPFSPPTRSDSPTIPSGGHHSSHPLHSPALPTPPTSAGGKSLLARMRTIAPGPFEIRRGSDDRVINSPITGNFSERFSSRQYSIAQLQSLAVNIQDQQPRILRETVGMSTVGPESLQPAEQRSEERWKEPRKGDQNSVVPPARERNVTDPLPDAPDRCQLKRSETAPPPETVRLESGPLSPTRPMTLPSKPLRVPPHGAGLGLPRTPSQFRRMKMSSGPKELPPPLLPIESQVETGEYQAYSEAKHAATLSVSSSSSGAFSRASKSSISTAPASDVSVASRTSGSKFVDPKTFDRDQRKAPILPRNSANEIDSLKTKPLAPIDNLNSKIPPPGEQRFMAPLNPSQQRPRMPEGNPKSKVPPPLGIDAPPPASQPPAPSPSRGHKRTQTAKGPCRGCGEQIVGKSISSADGRLTGRYHKRCFVCQACQQLFQSAEFYVLDNHPFCHYHYHELNHSLCQVCNYGIEGPCLETVQRERFHPGCFGCYKCGCVLQEDYFEINGRPFCEHHAMRYMQRPRQHAQHNRSEPKSSGLAPNVKVERRRTRLMFMGLGAPVVPGLGGQNHPLNQNGEF